MLEQFTTAVAAAKFPKQLDEICRTIWQAHAAGALSDNAAQEAAEAAQARRAIILALSSSKPALAARRPPRPRSPDRQKSIERRRRWAASGAMPPQIAAGFTMGEVAALAVIARQVQQHGQCRLPIDAVAALAGVCRTTVKNAVRTAAAAGLVHVEERRRPGGKNLPNIATVTDKSWRAWLKLSGRGSGVKKPITTFSDYKNHENSALPVDSADNDRNELARFGSLCHRSHSVPLDRRANNTWATTRRVSSV